MNQTGDTPARFISQPVPESADPGRPMAADPPVQPPGSAAGLTAAQLRLLAWSDLPERHRTEVCRQIRARCETFIGSVRVDKSERRTEIDRLVSEVVAHLLRATSLPKGEMAMDRAAPAKPSPASSVPAAVALPWLARGRLDPYEPMHDARVIWVIEETCNRQALFHRYEDVRRRDRGGKWDGAGYPLVAVEQQKLELLSGHYDPTDDETNALQVEDSRHAWRGLIELAQHHFGSGDDVVALIQILSSDRDTQDSFGSQWPIGKIARALNAGGEGAPWNDDRVENAKRRLTKFIVRFKAEHGLDAVDLRALLARYARQREAALQGSPQKKSPVRN